MHSIRLLPIWFLSIFAILVAQFLVVNSLNEPFFYAVLPEPFLTFWLKEFRPHYIFVFVLVELSLLQYFLMRLGRQRGFWPVIVPAVVASLCIAIMLVLYNLKIIHYSADFKSGVSYVSAFKVAFLPLIFSTPVLLIFLAMLPNINRNS